MKQFFLLLLILTLQPAAKSQVEFLVHVNPATGVHTIIDSLPPVNYIYVGATAFDATSKRYMFLGLDYSGAPHLYTVDALTGAILYQPACSLNVGEFEFDNSTNTLYGIAVNSSTTDLVALNLASGTAATVVTLPFSGYGVGQDCYDQAGHNYIVQNATDLYTVNVNTGAVTMVSAPAIYNEMQFDNTSGNAYALLFVSGTMQLVRIDMTTGLYTSLSTITPGYNTSSAAFNEISHRYAFDGIGHLVTVDVTTGTTFSTAAFPVGIVAPYNVIELHYDNSTGILYALHWGNERALPSGIDELTNQNSFGIYPNPATNFVTLAFKEPYAKTGIYVFNAVGELVMQQETHFAKTIQLQTSNLASGVYTVHAVCNGLPNTAFKLVVE